MDIVQSPVLIINPQAKGGQLKTKWNDAFSKDITDIIGQFKSIFTDSPEDATKQTRQALKNGARLVVAVGGDGTVNKVVNGFFENGSLINPHAALGILPMGTGNDFCRTLNIPPETTKALGTIKEKRQIPVDVCRVECKGLDGESSQAFFVNISSFGLTSEVVKRVNEKSDKFFGSLEYCIEGVSASLSYENRSIRISTDGKEPRTVEMRMSVVANGQFFGGNVHVAPTSSLGSGQMLMHTFSHLSISDVLQNLPNVLQSQPITLKPTTSYEGKKIVVEPVHEGQITYVEADGEVVGCLPATFEVMDRIQVIANLLQDPES